MKNIINFSSPIDERITLFHNLPPKLSPIKDLENFPELITSDLSTKEKEGLAQNIPAANDLFLPADSEPPDPVQEMSAISGLNASDTSILKFSSCETHLYFEA